MSLMLFRKTKAFSLLELIVVIVVLALLAALAIPTFMQVVSKTKLETAEVTVASLGREVVAIKSLDQEDLFNESNIMSAVKDLPLRAAAAGVYAAAADWEVLLQPTEFSTNSNILSVGMGGAPKGSELGMAVYVPGAGCAYGLAEGTQVQSWSVVGALMEVCSGEVALSGPDSGIVAPPAPGGLELTIGACANGEQGVIVDWEGAEFAEVIVNGVSLGGFGPGTCFPGLTLSDNIITEEWTSGGGGSTPGEGTTPPEKNETSVGGVLSGDVVAIRWDKELVGIGAGITIIRDGVPIPGPYGDGVHYDPSGIPGEHVYVVEVERSNGTKTTIPSTGMIIIPPVIDESEAPSRAAANGNTVRIQWGAVTDSAKAPLGGYRVYHARSSLAAPSEWEMLTDMAVPVENTYYDHAKLSLGLHCYYVTAYGPGGESGRSTVSCAKVEITPTPKGMVLSDIASASEHTCGVASGKVYCSGWTNDGRLGTIPANANTLRPLEMPVTGTPLEGKTVTSVSASINSTCVLASGEPVCWGGGGGATGTASIRKVDTTSAAGGSAKFTAIDTATAASCAVSNGKAYCWGASYLLGRDTSSTSQMIAQPITPGAHAALNGSVTDVKVGVAHACALAGGSVYCWGQGPSGELGNGLTGNSRLPLKVVDNGEFVNSGIIAISAGSGQSCAVKADGKAYCWGKGNNLGTPSATVNSSKAVPVLTTGVLAGEKITSIEGTTHGSGNATCATTESGKVICWQATPTLITFPNPDAGISARKVSMGGGTACALTGDGTYCWGSNNFGQFGNGTIVSSTLPSPYNP